MDAELKSSLIACGIVIAIIFSIACLFEFVFSKKYYCTQCGAMNVKSKTKSNYGCAMSILDLIFLIGAIPTCGVSLLGCLLIHCCVRKTKICRECGCENCLIPMNSPSARKAIKK